MNYPKLCNRRLLTTLKLYKSYFEYYTEVDVSDNTRENRFLESSIRALIIIVVKVVLRLVYNL